MFRFAHEGKTFEVFFRYPKTWVDGYYSTKASGRGTAKPGRFSVCAIMYEIVGTLRVPHETKGFVNVPEKSLRGEQTYVVPLMENKCSKRQARERALSNLLKRKGFSRLDRLKIFAEYGGKILNDRQKAHMLRVEAAPQKVLVLNQSLSGTEGGY